MPLDAEPSFARSLTSAVLPSGVAPSGRDDVAYYNCLSRDSTAECGAPDRFDPAALAADIGAVVTAPRADAEALVHRHGYLTRLWTSMRVEQMTIDPVFAPDPGLPDVSNVHRATYVTACSGDYYREDAPTHWEIAGETVEDDPGRPADDDAYCARRGGVLDPPDCSDERTSSGGCLCGVAGVAPIQGGILGGLALLFFARRLRRK